MSDKRKRCVLHVGAGLTGAPVFQSVCERARDELKIDDVDYPPDPREQECDRETETGNAICLRNYLLNPRPESFAAQANKRMAWMQIAASPARTLVLSDDALHKAPVERLKELRAHLSAHGRSVEVVFVVREATSHAVAAYGRLVRDQGLRQSFAEFVFGHKPPFFASAERLALAFGRENIRPVIYSADPRETAGAIFDRIGVDAPAALAAGADSEAQTGARALALLRALNALSDNPKVRKRVAAALLRETPSNAEDGVGRAPLPAAALDRFRADARALAALLFNRDAPALEPLTTAPAALMRPYEIDPMTERALEAAVAGWTAAFAARPEPRLRRGLSSAARLVGRRFGLGQG